MSYPLEAVAAMQLELLGKLLGSGAGHLIQLELLLLQGPGSSVGNSFSGSIVVNWSCSSSD